MKSGIERRLSESLEVALTLADDIVVVNTYEGGDQLFSRRLACVSCGISMPEMTPRAFSFNSPHGACQGCQGLGATYDFDPRLVVPDESKSLLTGRHRAVGARGRKLVKEAVQTLGRTYGFDPATPFAKLPKKHRDLILLGPSGGAKAAAVTSPRAASDDEGDDDRPGVRAAAIAPGRARPRRGGAEPFGKRFEGVIPNLRRRYDEGSWAAQEDLEPYRTLRECPVCHGQRLKPREPRRQGQGPRPCRLRQPADQRALDRCSRRSSSPSAKRSSPSRVLREIRERLASFTRSAWAISR